MTQPKPFQLATVDAVMSAFRSKRRFRRFLVADEVGLGKTIVAQQVIRRMMEHRQRPLTVFYMCSNLAIARQNRDNLLKVLPSDERESADCQVDRLSLLSVRPSPTHHSLHLYSLTPDTSIPIRKKQRRDGRQEERALVHALIERACPQFFEEWDYDVFQRNAGVWWEHHVERQEEQAANTALRQAFIESVRKEFGVKPNKQLLPILRQFEDRQLDLIAHMRNALAASAIERVQPDLVIFDEFQRFRDLLNPKLEEAERRVIGRLRGDDTENPPALLMLSATPYRLFSRRWEDEGGTSHRSQFFELIEFLYGGDNRAKKKRGDSEVAFQALEGELRKGHTKSDGAKIARTQIEQLLRPIMARTERASHEDGWTELHTEQLPADLHGADMRVFKHLSDSFQPNHRASAVAYWTSIPLPMQTMGRHYVAWRESESASTSGAAQFDQSMRNKFRAPASWPHPRLRALSELVTSKQLATPWLPPTAPWWKLGGAWKNAETTPRKLLVFSRFRAVPQTIASMLSFGVESSLLSRENLPYPEVTKRRLLSATENRHALLGLFHPSPFLIRETDPLSRTSGTIGEVRAAIRRQLGAALKEIGVKVSKGARHVPIWKMLAQLDFKTGDWEWTSNAWWQLHRQIATGEYEDSGLAQLLTDWDEAAEQALVEISPGQFGDLINHALSSPGVVVGRALFRHWPEVVTEEGFFGALDTSWTGLRNYFDQRWFFLSLCRKKETYPDAIQRAVLEGNLEAVLDEHLWITSRLRSLDGAELADELRDGLSIKSGMFYVHPLVGNREDTFSVRCHAALPFAQQRRASLDDSDDKPVRTDELRKAFNTPFWPYVLATTSVGQEGLDFHAWCDTLVHWDLCRNPADLEQREGRIQRFGGLSIRRAIAEQLDAEPFVDLPAGVSPWSQIEERANSQLSDESGLAPWWVCKGGGITRYVFNVPTSEQNHWLHWVHEQRLLYRLALGQPNQEDLLEVLSSKGETSPEDVRDAVINLSPWFRREGANANEQ